MVDPPSDSGADHHTMAAASPVRRAVTPVGAPGSVAGVNHDGGAAAGPVPSPLVAVTANV